MTPVFQTLITSSDGNCYAACMASILDLGLDDVPDIGPVSGWQVEWREWLDPFGISMLNLPYPYEEGMLTDHIPILMPGYTILAVLSPKYAPKLHAVVCYNGEIVHDPQPGNSHEVNPVYYDFIRYRSNWREYEVFVTMKPSIK